MSALKKRVLFYHVFWTNGCHEYLRPVQYHAILPRERKFITHVKQCSKVAVQDYGIWVPVNYTSR